ncbi:MAG: cytochrome P450, partial [Polyangiaceae bacterium]|nr:cytochrome P450 [Polyangiaceae bacterium]
MHIREVPLLGGGHSLWGHLPDFSTDKLSLIKLIIERTEPMVQIQSPIPREVVCVNHPDVLRELLVEKAHIFQKSYLMRYALYPLAGEGLFTAQWEKWKPNRKLMSPLFQPSELGRYAESMSACADQTIRTFEDGKTRELFEDTTRMTMSVAGKTLFDADTFSEADEIGHALTIALGWANENTPSATALAHVLTRLLTNFVADKMAPVIAEPMHAFADTLTGPRYAFGESTKKMQAAIALLDRRVQTMIDERRAHPTGKTDLL